MPKKKKVGGVKRRGRNAPAVPPATRPRYGATRQEKDFAAEVQAPVTPRKKTGGVTAKHVERPGYGEEFLRRAHKGCPAQCLGHRFADGRWIHDLGCPWVVVEWDMDHGRDGIGATYTGHWPCQYTCPPHRIAGGWTHDWRCPFWDNGDWRQVYPAFPDTGPTPFSETEPIPF